MNQFTKINKAVAEALADPAVKDRLRAMGMEPSPSDPKAFGKSILEDRATLADVIEKNHITTK